MHALQLQQALISLECYISMHALHLQHWSFCHHFTLSQEHIDTFLCWMCRGCPVERHIHRVVSALDATADKTKKIKARQKQLKQAVFVV